jgi:hypothetical protein
LAFTIKILSFFSITTSPAYTADQLGSGAMDVSETGISVLIGKLSPSLSVLMRGEDVQLKEGRHTCSKV